MSSIEPQVEAIVDTILEDYRNGRAIDKIDHFRHPDKEIVTDMIGKLMRIVYPGATREKAYRIYNARHNLSMLIEDVMYNLNKQLTLLYTSELGEQAAAEKAQELSVAFFRAIPEVRAVAQTDVEAFFDGDPAAFSVDEIIFCYPGLFAVTVYRLAHVLYALGVPLLPRIMTEHAHSVTGIDINPGATIGKYFFIDHGTGIVVGETTVIGDHVKVYQGVTLGGTGKDLGKRHPTIENGVMIGSGAKVLGPITIGRNAKVAAGAVVVKDVEPNCTVVGVPGEVVRIDGERVDDLDQINLPDPVMNAIQQNEAKINALQAEIERLKEQLK